MELEQIIIIALFGGIAAVENATIRFLLAEPIVLCTAAGAMMGDMEAGLKMGCVFQLIWMKDTQMNAARIPDGISGSLIGAVLYVSLLPRFESQENILFILCFLGGICCAYLGIRIADDKRRLLDRYNEYVDAMVESVRPKGIESVFILGLIEQFFFGALFAGLLFVIFYFPLNLLIQRIPLFWDELFKNLSFAIFGIGAAFAIKLFLNRRTIWGLLLGIFFAVFLHRMV